MIGPDWNVTPEELTIAANEALSDFNAADGENETEASSLLIFRRKAVQWFEAGNEMRLLPFETCVIDYMNFRIICNALLSAQSVKDILAVFGDREQKAALT